MTWWQALILGIVEGLTEYLPVSSTGHLILTAWLLGLDDPESKAAVDSFNIVIQAGAIAAVLGLYWPRVKQMVFGLAGKDPDGLRLAINLILAFLPAAVLGLLLHATIKAHLFAPGPVVGALAVGGVLMIAVGVWRKRTGAEARGGVLTTIVWWQALVIGFAQAVAMWPGTSRSMMTIVAAMVVGLRSKAAAEFSFLLGLITLGAATVYEGYDSGPAMVETFGWAAIVIGFIAATISAALAVKWFVAFLTKHGLAVFGWYRLALAAVFAAAVFTGAVTLDEPEEASAASGVVPAIQPAEPTTPTE